MTTNKFILNKKIKFINLQMLAIIGFIIALLISYLLGYDKKMSLEDKKRLFSNKEAQNLAVFQTILVFIVTLCFLYINYNQYKISKEEKQDSTDFILQIETSIFAIISSIIGLYIIFKNYKKENISISEVDTL
ncbi:MAG: hypothetical protein IJ094_07615 [Bacilli bacterium]|nr:hypothetical protein [Bacilli bacterium]